MTNFERFEWFNEEHVKFAKDQRTVLYESQDGVVKLGKLHFYKSVSIEESCFIVEYDGNEIVAWGVLFAVVNIKE